MKHRLLRTLCFGAMLTVGSELSIGTRPACSLFLWSCRTILPATQVEQTLTMNVNVSKAFSLCKKSQVHV